MEPYRPRKLVVRGVEERDGWRLKRYAISVDESGFEWNDFAEGLERAWAALPRPAVADGRAGVGFVIAHRGSRADYVVLGWWDRENELPVRVFVKPEAEPAFRPARDAESFCVWDLRVIAAERGAYVATVLSTHGPDVEGYLYRFCDSEG